MKISEDDFENIRPYNDCEINAALKRIIEAPAFAQVAKFVFPEKPVEETYSMLKDIESSDEFQVKFLRQTF